MDITKQFVTRVSRREFWQDERHWPREGPINGTPALFITRAFDLIGRHLFPAEWLGVEGWFEPVATLPAIQRDADEYTLRLVERVLSDRHPEYRGIMPIPRTAGGLGDFGGIPTDQVPARFRPAYQPFHDDDWTAAAKIFEGAARDTRPAIERREAVSEWLATYINDERKLRVIVVDRRTGFAGWGEAAHWNCRPHELEGRWLRGTYYIDNPFVPVVDGPRPLGREVRIFLVEADLSALLNGEKGIVADDTPGGAQEITTATKPARRVTERSSRDEDDNNAALEIRNARTKVDLWRKANPDVRSFSAIAEGASGSAGLSKETLRQMLAGRHPLSNRLVEAGRLKAWQ